MNRLSESCKIEVLRTDDHAEMVGMLPVQFAEMVAVVRQDGPAQRNGERQLIGIGFFLPCPACLVRGKQVMAKLTQFHDHRQRETLVSVKGGHGQSVGLPDRELGRLQSLLKFEAGKRRLKAFANFFSGKT